MEADPSAELEINLPEQKITWVATGESESFDINDYKKNKMLNGFDDIDYLLNIKKDIETFAENTPL